LELNVQRRYTALAVATASLLLAGSALAQQAVFEVKESPQQSKLIEWTPQQKAAGVVTFESQNGALLEIATSPQRSIVEVRPNGNFFFRSRGGGLTSRVLANAEELELTDSQTTEIRDLQRDHRRDKIRRDADIEIAELELDEMLEAADPALDAVEAHMRQIANLGVDARLAELRLDRAVKGTLTAQQVDSLEEMATEFTFRTVLRESRNR
jgi:Spy/CpxP family protein refolding chaperone